MTRWTAQLIATVLAVAGLQTSAPAAMLGAARLVQWVETAAQTAGEKAETPYLESGGFGCHDPQSWVWQAPRAERIALDVPIDVPCERGIPGCASTAANAFDPSTESPVTAHAVCTLKRAQHNSALAANEFDDKACLQAERVALRESAAPLRTRTPEPQRELACSESDPECQSLPPLPGEPTSPKGPTPSADLLPPDGLASIAPHALWSNEGLRPCSGVHRRIDRPPNPTMA